MVSLKGDFMRREKIKVIFDTNMLLLSVQKPLDIFSEVGRVLNAAYTPAVLTATINELNRMLTSGRPKEKIESKLALELAKKCEIIEYEASVDNADRAIIEYARKNRVIVATNDIELRRRLRKLGIPVIFLRGFDHLELEGEIY